MKLSTTQQLVVVFVPLLLFATWIVTFHSDGFKRTCPRHYETIKSDHVGSRFQAFAETRAIVNWQKKSETVHKGFGTWHNAADRKLRCSQISAVYTYCRAFAKPCFKSANSKLTQSITMLSFRVQS